MQIYVCHVRDITISLEPCMYIHPLLYLLPHQNKTMSTYPDPPCPFCAIASKYSPIPPSSPETTTTGTSPIPSPNTTQEPDDQNQPQTHLILSTKHVLAFLDIMPLTRGHVLVVTREHYGKLGEVGVQVGMEVCIYITWSNILDGWMDGCTNVVYIHCLARKMAPYYL